MVLPVGQSNAVQTLIRIVKTAERARLHRPRRGALRAPCRRGGTGRIGLASSWRTMGRPRWATTSATRRAAPAGRLICCGVGTRRLRRLEAQPAGRRRHRPRRGAAAGRCANAAPDSRGVITYATYQVAVARDGDTLGRRRRPGSAPPHGALAQAQRPARRTTSCAPGEVLLLPERRPADRTGGLDSGTVTSQPLGWTPDQASAAIDSPAGGTAAARRRRTRSRTARRSR